VNDHLRSTLRCLRLSGLAGSLDIRLQEAQASRLSHLEFLELVLQDEVAVRDHRKLDRRTKLACFRDLKTIDQFDWDFNTSLPRRQLFELATCKFLDDAILARYLRPDLLIIDDMGMKQLPKRSGEYLFEIIMRRHQTRSTIMTSNRPLEDRGKLLGDVPSASAILDRFLHHAEIVTFQGRSYRLRNRLNDDSDHTVEPSATPKPASAPTGNRRAKPASAADATNSTTSPT
jgi:DNA replication protein DnaC